jgi:dTMP kinase
LADRSEHFQEIIKPNLSKNKTVISDRSIISGLAYAQANNLLTEKNKIEDLLKFNLFATENRLPDYAIFIEIQPEDLEVRYFFSKKYDNIEKRGFEYLLKVQNNIKFWLEKLQIETLYLKANDSKEKNHKKIVNFIENTKI